MPLHLFDTPATCLTPQNFAITTPGNGYTIYSLRSIIPCGDIYDFVITAAYPSVHIQQVIFVSQGKRHTLTFCRHEHVLPAHFVIAASSIRGVEVTTTNIYGNANLLGSAERVIETLPSLDSTHNAYMARFAPAKTRLVGTFRAKLRYLRLNFISANT